MWGRGGSALETKRTEKGRGDPYLWSISPLEILVGCLPNIQNDPRSRPRAPAKGQTAFPALQRTQSFPPANLGLATPQGENGNKSKYSHRPQGHTGVHVCVHGLHTHPVWAAENNRGQSLHARSGPRWGSCGAGSLPQRSDTRADEAEAEGATWVNRRPGVRG